MRTAASKSSAFGIIELGRRDTSDGLDKFSLILAAVIQERQQTISCRAETPREYSGSSNSTSGLLHANHRRAGAIGDGPLRLARQVRKGAPTNDAQTYFSAQAKSQEKDRFARWRVQAGPI